MLGFLNFSIYYFFAKKGKKKLSIFNISCKINSPQIIQGGNDMLINDFNAEFVGLQDIIVKKVEKVDKDLVVDIEVTVKTHICPVCGAMTNTIHDYRTQHVKHVPPAGGYMLLRYKKRRYRCNCCNKRFYENQSFLPKKHSCTSSLYAQIFEKTKKSHTYKDIAESLRISPTTVCRIFDMISFSKPKLPSVIALDEFRGNAGGHKFQTIVTNPETRETLDILPSRNTNDLYTYFKSFPDRDNVKFVVIDMSSIYAPVVKACFPKAKIIIDKFHFVRQVLWALENVRKRVQNSFSISYRRVFKRGRKLLLAKHYKLNETGKIKLLNMLNTTEDLRMAYAIKSKFYEILDSEDSYTAKRGFGEWTMMGNYNLPEFEQCFKTFINWMPEILNYFDYRYTNAYTEGMNNKIKTLKRISYGVRNFQRFRKRILWINAA